MVEKATLQEAQLPEDKQTRNQSERNLKRQSKANS